MGIMTILSFLWQYRTIVIIALLSTALVGLYFYSDIRIKQLKNEVIKLQVDLKDCQQANAVMADTNDKLQKEIKDSATIYKKIIQEKDREFAEYRRIQDIKEPENEKDHGSINDPMYNELIRMWSYPTNSK